VIERQSAAVRVAGRHAGEVAVGYCQARPRLDEGPFLREERHLLDAVAHEIAQVVERKQAEAERRALQDQLQHADRLATIGQLAAGVAHELNEPLGSILGFAQLAQRSAGLDGQVLRDLGRIESAALHSREIVRKLNLFARQAPASRCAVQLNTVVEESMLFLESRCAKEGIGVELALESDLPEVYADAGQLMQVLVNLVVNAIQAMPAGGRLDVATRSRPGTIELSVADQGQGIAPEVAEHIFEPFFTTKDVGQGTGLGLSVVHGIVAAHGGRIEVDSAPGDGARFTVELPLEEPDVRTVE
jgi:signal transduction histidine kinase